MKMRKITAMLMAGAMCMSSMFANVNLAKAAQTDDAQTLANTSSVQEIIDGMTVRQKITQMMMPDFRYWDEDLTDDAGKIGVTELNSQIQKIVEDYDFGGVILFAQNVTGTLQTLNLTKQYQAAATKDGGIPLMISIDQEGGSVYRLGTGTALPGNMAIGATGSEEYAKMAGEIIGRELSSLGINCNFAPVVDTNNNPNNPVIGLRSFSDDPQTVAKMGVAVINGMNEYNIATSAKHFPGHGDTATDSHTGLPEVNKSLEELKQLELVPFQAAMDAGADMFMTAHIVYPQVDDTKVVSQKTGEEVYLPATLSKKILTDLVRGDMNYEGVLITDAMNMAGVSGNFGQVEASIRAIQAGIDMLLMPCVLYDLEDLADLDAIINGIEAAVADGSIPEERLNESCARILTLKEKRGILDYDAEKLTEEKALETVGSEQNRAAEREIAAAAVTVVKNENNVLPLNLNFKSRVLFLTPYTNELPCIAMGWTRGVEAGVIPSGAECRNIRYSSGSTLNTAAIKDALAWADTVVVNSEVSSANNMQSTKWVTKFPTDVTDYCKANGKKSVVISVDKPYDVQHYANADAVMAVYGCKGSSADPTEILVGGITTTKEAFGPNITAGVEVALGVFGASGTLPVHIYQYDEATRSYTDQIVYSRGHGIFYDSIKDTVKVTISYKGLEMLMAAAENFDASEYTAESWAAVEEALAAAKAVAADADATQADVDAAVSALVAALGNLEYGIQKLHLETAVKAAEDILVLADNYKDTEALVAAVEAGKAVLADKNADQDTVNAAAYAILDELAKLAKTADITSLESLIDAAKDLLDGSYTDGSLQDLKDAIAKAEEVINDPNRGDGDISDAYSGLIDAIISLEMKGNKAALHAMIVKANAILANADAYVASTIEGLKEVLADAQAVYDDDNAVQSTVNEAVKTLTLKVAEARLIGDVDHNGVVNTSDSAALLAASAELITLDTEAAASADVNGDGVADTSDAALILQYAAEKIAAF